MPNWDRAVEECDPASLLVVIASRLGSRGVTAEAEDVLQESLCRAWAARDRVEWRGPRAFRAWILTIIDHCISDLGRRAAVRRESPLSSRAGDSGDGFGGIGLAAGSSTPSRRASYREQAALIAEALGALEPETRDIIVQRLLMQRELEQIAETLGVGVGAVRHRFRTGCESYRRELRRAMGQRASQSSRPPTQFGDAG